MNNANTVKYPGHTLLNLRGSYKFAKGWEAWLQARNLTRSITPIRRRVPILAEDLFAEHAEPVHARGAARHPDVTAVSRSEA